MIESAVSEPIAQARVALERVKQEVAKVIVGQKEMVDALLIALLADGHLLLEGVPGIAKTLAANTLARTVKAAFKRIQFTPDLLPADLTGTPIYNPKEGTFDVKKGPVFTNFLLADEINRAPAKVQSALLEIMQEKQVTLGGETYPAPRPFLVIATQNPIEQEGTYPLAEAQADRFMMKIKIGYPSREEEKEIMQRMGSGNPPAVVNPVLDIDALLALRKLSHAIRMSDEVANYLVDLIQSTREPKRFSIPIEGLLEYGASPRATIALKSCAEAHALCAGRDYVTPLDIKEMAYPVLRHRLRLSYEAEAENLTTDDIIHKILDTLPLSVIS